MGAGQVLPRHGPMPSWRPRREIRCEQSQSHPPRCVPVCPMVVALAKTTGPGYEELVPELMSKPFVDAAETIDVDQQDTDVLVVLASEKGTGDSVE